MAPARLTSAKAGQTQEVRVTEPHDVSPGRWPHKPATRLDITEVSYGHN
jgi:hypothetical protein